VFRTLEHEVFEQMRQSAAPDHLVLRSDVVPDVHRNDRQVMVLMDDHLEAVAEDVLGEWNQLTGVRGMALRA
jgi:hypothetical protein